jgi:hypothetical protein
MVDLGDASAGADTDRALCEQILSCTRQTQCVAQEPVMSDPNYQPGTYCFCGTLTPDACFGGVVGGPNYKPDGPCSALILQAYPAGSPPVAYGSAYFDTATPIGAAIQRALGEASFCANQCGLTGAAGAGP